MLLSDCDANVTSHLICCHLSQSSDLTESDLIISRAGIRGLSFALYTSLTICPRHRNLLGRFWRPPKSCQYPGHSGKTSVEGRHVINVKIGMKYFSSIAFLCLLDHVSNVLISILFCDLFLFCFTVELILI